MDSVKSNQPPFLNLNQPTFDDLVALIEADGDLTLQRRRNVVSSLRTMARALSRPLTSIPAHSAWLRWALKDFHWQSAGLTKSRWRNLRSDVSFALQHSNLARQFSGSYMPPLSESWLRLFAQTEDERFRWNLSRLARFASSLQISPNQVTDDLVMDFRQALVEDSLLKDPNAVVRNTINNWNKAVGSVPGWPQLQLTQLPSKRRDFAIPLSEFPESFQAEILDWQVVLSGHDPLAEEAVDRPLRPVTIRHMTSQVRRFASALVLSGIDIAEIKSFSVLVEVEAFKSALRFLLARNGGQRSEALTAVANTLRMIAKHHVRVSVDHLAELTRICRRIAIKTRGMTERNRELLRQFDDPANVAALVTLPGKLLDQAKRMAVDRKTALKVQMALAIELLLMAPVRRKNLASIHLERNLQWSRSARRGVVHLCFAGSEIKNGQPLEFELPPHLVEMMRCYIDAYRPLLLQNHPNEWLFPGRGGNHKALHALSAQIAKTVFEHAGVQVHVHLFRHIGAKLYLDSNPGNYEIVRRTLGHRTIDTTTAHYTDLEDKAAIRRFDQTISALRDQMDDTNGRQGGAE